MTTHNGITPMQTRIRAYEAGPVWRARANRYRKTKRACQGCGRRDAPLDVHHVTYDHAFAGKEPDRDLRALCRPCHDDVHALTRGPHRVSLRKATSLIVNQRRRKRQRRYALLAGLTIMFLVAVTWAVYTYADWPALPFG